MMNFKDGDEGYANVGHEQKALYDSSVAIKSVCKSLKTVAKARSIRGSGEVAQRRVVCYASAKRPGRQRMMMVKAPMLCSGGSLSKRCVYRAVGRFAENAP